MSRSPTTMKRILFCLCLISGIQAAGCRNEVAVPTATIRKAAVSGPQASVPETSSNLGEVDFARAYAHGFDVANTGDAPLQLAVTKKSCRCSSVDLTPSEIAPGTTGKVVLNWTPVPGKIGPYRLSADVETNDPHRPAIHLEVEAVIQPLIRVWPEDWYFIDFKQIQPGRTQSRDIKIFSTELGDFELLADCSHPGLRITTTRLPAGTLVGETPTKCAYRVEVQTTDKLPPGYFRELLNLHVKGSQPREMTLPVYGEIDTAAFRIAPQVLEFKTAKLSAGDSLRAQIQFLVPRDNEKVLVVRSEPAFIEVEPPKQLKRGLWHLTIRIPPKNAEAVKLQADGYFEGSVVLKTSATGETAVPIRLKWSVPE